MTFEPEAGGTIISSLTFAFRAGMVQGNSWARSNFVIHCVRGGPTYDFKYSVEWETSSSKYATISTTADCTPHSPVGPLGYWCIDNSVCLYGPRPDSSYKGGTSRQCNEACTPHNRTGQYLEQ